MSIMCALYRAYSNLRNSGKANIVVEMLYKDIHCRYIVEDIISESVEPLWFEADVYQKSNQSKNITDKDIRLRKRIYNIAPDSIKRVSVGRNAIGMTVRNHNDPSKGLTIKQQRELFCVIANHLGWEEQKPLPVFRDVSRQLINHEIR